MDEHFRLYFDAWKRYFTEERFLALYAHLASKIEDGDRVVHGLSGLGYFALHLLNEKSRCSVWGLDHNPHMVEHAIKLLEGRATFECVFVGPEDLEAYESDVFLISSCHLLDDFSLLAVLKKARSKTRRILLYCDEPNRMAQETGNPLNEHTCRIDTSWDGASETSYLRTPSVLEGLVKAAGFKKVSLEIVPSHINAQGYLVVEAH